MNPQSSNPDALGTKPLRILHVIGSLDPATGGPVEALLRSTEALSQRGHHTEVATLDPPSAPFLGSFSFTVHAHGTARRRYGYSSALVPWLRRNRERFDIAIAHGVWNYASLGTWRGLNGGKTPYFVYAHGMLDATFSRRQRLKWQAKKMFWWALESRVVRDAAAVLFTSEEESRLALEAFPTPPYPKRVVRYCTADVSGRSDAQIAAFQEHLPSLAGRPFLLFLSRIHPKKGCDLLVRAFAEIAQVRPELQLVMAGPDQNGWKSELIGIANDLGVGSRIHWPGIILDDAKWGAFRSCEAFVLPSHQENFGIVITEAMSCGVPVLTTDKVNIWRDVHDTGSGLVATDDIEGTKRLLRDFLALSTGERELMRKRARETFVSRFSIDQAAEDLLRAIREVRT